MLVKIKAFPAANTEEIKKVGEDYFEIKVREKPIMGQANNRIRELLALSFGVPLSKVRLIKGFKERNKIFKVN